MFEETFKNIDDVLWKDAECGSELDFIINYDMKYRMGNPQFGEEY